MSLYRDKQIRGFCLFLTAFSILALSIWMIFGLNQISNARAWYLTHDEAVASSLLEQGVPKDVIAVALTNTEINGDGQSLVEAAGIGMQSEINLLPFISQFQQSTFYHLISIVILLTLLLIAGTLIFFRQRERLYLQADKVLTSYINGNYSCHLPQNDEGGIFQIFTSVEQLATMLQSKSETEYKARNFLKNTISDISHQLKTPLAALTMYQEIIENEPENADTVKQFSHKMGISLKRMEQLIQSMLKITRLDAGNIIFEKKICHASELIAHSIHELTIRAKKENKEILVSGDCDQLLVCDMEWTGEAIENIVKNALDHTKSGGTVHITWQHTPAMFRILITDDGNGIAPEDIHHIFKRFYRSRHSFDTQGVGLGLSLAKSIIEGQGGFISVQSEFHTGTTFMISFLTES